MIKGSKASQETRRLMSIAKKKNRNGFKNNHIPWNKGKKCPWVINNPQTFKKGERSMRKGIILPDILKKQISKTMKIKIPRLRKEKYKDAITRMNGKRYRTSRLVWMQYNKVHRIPQGLIIHHLDFNPKNNNINNLQLLTERVHGKFHGEFAKRLHENNKNMGNTKQ